MRHQAHARVLENLVSRAPCEVLPITWVLDKVHPSLPVGATPTALPAKGLAATLEVAERLPVLHDADGRKGCIPTADAEPEAGAFHSALQVIKDLAAVGNPFTDVAITGYPERYPSIHHHVTVQAMRDKRRYATQLVSKLTFDPKLLTDWITQVPSRDVQLPVLGGLSRFVKRAKLRMETRISVGGSARCLVKNGRLFTWISAPGGYDPMRFLHGAAATPVQPDMHVAGLHLFTFNRVAETQALRVAQLAGLRGLRRPGADRAASAIPGRLAWAH